jgi:hypothetical protein
VLRWDGGEFRVLSCAPNLLAGVKHSSRSFCDVVTFTSSHSIRCEHSELVASIALLDVHSQLQLNHRLVCWSEDEKDDDDMSRKTKRTMTTRIDDDGSRCESNNNNVLLGSAWNVAKCEKNYC